MFCRNCGANINEKAEVCMQCGFKPLTETNYCQECGGETNEKQDICVKCGCRLKKPGSGGINIEKNGDMVYPSDPPKSAVTATLLSCFISGIGQIYLGQTLKGLAWLVGGILLTALSGGLLGIPVWVAVMIDANKIAKKLEQGQPVGQWEFF